MMRYGGCMAEQTERVRISSASRAPRSEGPRTTLRLPDALAQSADRLAEELGISRNDAVLRLATRGAQIYEQEQAIEARRAARWAAVFPGAVAADDAAFPSPEEARAAVRSTRDEEPTAPVPRSADDEPPAPRRGRRSRSATS
jgi:hypothetical protein